MKKNFLLLTMIAFMIGISSCGSKSSFESDVKKMAKYRCKEQQLMAKDQSDEKVKKELSELKEEIEEYRKKMSKKYEGKEKDEEMNKKADQIMDEEMAKCK